MRGEAVAFSNIFRTEGFMFFCGGIVVVFFLIHFEGEKSAKKKGT